MKIPDFTPTERALVEEMIGERYGYNLAPELADTELRLRSGRTRTDQFPDFLLDPAWRRLVIFSTANRYRNQFFYSMNEQYATDRTDYEDSGECVGVLLRRQADHEKIVLA